MAMTIPCLSASQSLVFPPQQQKPQSLQRQYILGISAMMSPIPVYNKASALFFNCQAAGFIQLEFALIKSLLADVNAPTKTTVAKMKMNPMRQKTSKIMRVVKPHLISMHPQQFISGSMTAAGACWTTTICQTGWPGWPYIGWPYIGWAYICKMFLKIN